MRAQSVLHQLAHPGTVENFVREASLHPRIFSGVGTDLVDLLTVQDVDRLITITGLRPPFIVLVNARTGVTSADYKLYIDGAIRCANPGRILGEQLKHGTTIIVQHIHLLHPGIRALVENLSQDLHPMSIHTNCYLTPSHAQGVSPHIDQHHTLLFQLSGKKRWCIWENIDDDPNQPMINTRSDPDLPKLIVQNSRPLLDQWLEPGDFILIPRGFVHTSYTGNSHSLHITLGITDPGEQTATELIFRRVATEADWAAFGNGRLATAFYDVNRIEEACFTAPLTLVEVI
jgi:hypothetical protein